VSSPSRPEAGQRFVSLVLNGSLDTPDPLSWKALELAVPYPQLATFRYAQPHYPILGTFTFRLVK